MRIVGYSYKAANYCNDCIVKEVAGITPKHYLTGDTEYALSYIAKNMNIDRMDERTYDSDDFPKVIFADQVEDDETCSNCGQTLS